MQPENWIFCATPDWNNRDDGQFDGNAFWYKESTGDIFNFNNPPPIDASNNDQVAFAVEVTKSGTKYEYSVDDITVVSTIRLNPLPTNGAAPAEKGSPFRSGNNIICHHSGGPVTGVVTIPVNGINRKFRRSPLHSVYDDGSGNPVSAYEITMCTTLRDLIAGTGSFEFSTDPEMDVGN